MTKDMSITLTELAASRVRDFLSTDNSGVGLRVGIKTNGCSGYAYVVNLAKEVTNDDAVYESYGVKVVVDTRNLPLIDGTLIDFTKQGLNEAFSYENPNVKHECGCGESFGV
ncbi:MAG: iron-sulfur cluster assembly protein [Gammaproteobacteria bacterium]|jgi:iron-sulfur cluster assembly protein